MPYLQMDKDKATCLLRRQLDAIEDLKQRDRNCPEYKKWLRDTSVALEHVFGAGSRQVKDFDAIWRSVGGILARTPESTYQKWHVDRLVRAGTVLESIVQEVDEFWEEPVAVGAGSGQPFAVSIEKIFQRFHLVALQLGHRHSNRNTIRIKDEYDVQDLLHALLRIDFDDVRPEEWTPSYAGKSSRTDFLLKQEQVFIEVKKTRSGLTEKALGDQLIVDADRYGKHPDCENLFCFVYDPENRVRNPRGVEADLSRTHDGLPVKVFIRP